MPARSRTTRYARWRLACMRILPYRSGRVGGGRTVALPTTANANASARVRPPAKDRMVAPTISRIRHHTGERPLFLVMVYSISVPNRPTARAGHSATMCPTPTFQSTSPCPASAATARGLHSPLPAIASTSKRHPALRYHSMLCSPALQHRHSPFPPPPSNFLTFVSVRTGERFPSRGGVLEASTCFLFSLLFVFESCEFGSHGCRASCSPSCRNRGRCHHT